MILPARIFSLLDRFAFAGQIAFFQGQRPLGIFQFLRRRETAELRIRRRIFEHAVFLLAVDRRRIGFRMKRLFGWHFICSSRSAVRRRPAGRLVRRPAAAAAPAAASARRAGRRVCWSLPSAPPRTAPGRRLAVWQNWRSAPALRSERPAVFLNPADKPAKPCTEFA